MSNTPRTDAQKFRWDDLSPDEQWNRNGEYVSAEFAAELEQQMLQARGALQVLLYLHRQHQKEVTQGEMAIIESDWRAAWQIAEHVVEEK